MNVTATYRLQVVMCLFLLNLARQGVTGTCQFQEKYVCGLWEGMRAA